MTVRAYGKSSSTVHIMVQLEECRTASIYDYWQAARFRDGAAIADSCDICPLFCELMNGRPKTVTCSPMNHTMLPSRPFDQRFPHGGPRTENTVPNRNYITMCNIIIIIIIIIVRFYELTTV